jgi:hypothetical protein
VPGGSSGLLSAFTQLVMKKWTTNKRQRLDGKEIRLTNERVLFLPVGRIRLLNGWRNRTPNVGWWCWKRRQTSILQFSLMI